MGLIYPKFIFAAPPCVGEQTFVNAMLSCGATYEEPSKLSLHWPQGRDSLPRVLLVREPARWLQRFYELHHARQIPPFPRYELWRTLPRESFTDFVQAYLYKMPGAVSDLYRDYDASIVLRIEDAPWCFRTFAQSFGYERQPMALRDNVQPLEPWPSWLLAEVRAAEHLAYDRFSY